MRGQAAKEGDTNVSKNGYHYTRTENRWRLTHHLVAEKTLGRPLEDDERVSFKDKDKTNLKPSNVVVNKKAKSSNSRRLGQLYARRDEIQAQIDELENLS